MARALATRIHVRGTLVTTTPLAVGGAGDPLVDLPLAVDGRGRLYVPGTSLAGPLRHWAERSLAAEHRALVDRVFGFQQRNGTGGHAAWLIVEDATLLDATGARPESRDGIGIDRRTGTAATGFKLERQVLPRGSRLLLELELDLPSMQAEARHAFPAADGERLLDALLTALRSGEVRLGAAKTRGLGAVELLAEGLEIDRYDIASRPGHLFAWLRGRSSGAGSLASGAGLVRPRRRLDIEVAWQPLTPLMVKSGAGGLDIDSLPLLGRVDGGALAAVLPGSSLKGALRSTAERIVRTLAQRPTAEELAEQLDQPVVRDLFGSTAAAGWLSVPDAYQVARPVPLEQWRRQMLEAPQPEGAAGAEPWGTRDDHVAIDRFTGGAADGLLFSVLAPPRDGWDDLAMQVEIPQPPEGCEEEERRAHERRARAAIALLLVALRELAHGRVPLGFGVNRGLGAVSVREIRVQGGGETLAVGPHTGWRGLSGQRAGELTAALVAEIESAQRSAGGRS